MNSIRSHFLTLVQRFQHRSIQRYTSPILPLLACSMSLSAWTYPRQSGPDQFKNINLYYTASRDYQVSGWHPDVDQIVRQYMATTATAGCGVGLTDHGEVVFVEGYGIADTSKGESFDIDSMAPIGSVAKTITALSILRLQEDGHLDLDDHISDWFHHASSTWSEITIRQLLSHTSKLPKWPSWREDWQTQAQVESMYPFVERPTLYPSLVFPGYSGTEPVPFDPKKDHRYSNLGFDVLGALIDTITLSDPQTFGYERGYERYAWHTVGLPEYQWFDRHNMLTLVTAAPWREGDIPNISVGHTWNKQTQEFEVIDPEWDIFGPAGYGASSGGLLMTPGDLARLTLAFRRDGRVNQPASHDEMTQKYSNASGGYGLGVVLEDLDSRPTYSHIGNAAGHEAVWIYWPNEDVGVAAVCNSVTNQIRSLGVHLGRLMLAS